MPRSTGTPLTPRALRRSGLEWWRLRVLSLIEDPMSFKRLWCLVLASGWGPAAFVSCTTSSEPGHAAQEAGAQNTADTSSDSGPSDSATDSGPAFTTDRGGNKCCVKGTGTDCCGGHPGPYVDGSGGGCWQYAFYGACITEGRFFDPTTPCALCCAGLIDVWPLVPGNSSPPLPPGCKGESGGGPSKICLPCGNGACDVDAGENYCNCPQDCPRPDGGPDGGAH
jgi:hypothetical protein